MSLRFADVVGRYQLVVSDELRAFIERVFVEPAPEPTHAQVRAEALAEAAASELELAPEGAVISRFGEHEAYRVWLQLGPEPFDRIDFAKPSGEPVTLRWLDAERVEAAQPGKPNVVFRRAPSLR